MKFSTAIPSSAFTLVEMLLVLVILATLAAIVYPKVMGRSEQARVTSAQTQIANFKTALDAFEVDNGYYPKGKNGLNDLVVQPCRRKQLTNMRASTADIAVRLNQPRLLTIEQAIEWINDDELVEVTPSAIRVRKRILDHSRRRSAESG